MRRERTCGPAVLRGFFGSNTLALFLSLRGAGYSVECLESPRGRDSWVSGGDLLLSTPSWQAAVPTPLLFWRGGQQVVLKTPPSPTLFTA